MRWAREGPETVVEKGEEGKRSRDGGAQSNILQACVTAPRLGAVPGPSGAPRFFWAEHRAIKGGAEERHDLTLLAILELKWKQPRREPEHQCEAVPAFQEQIYGQEDNVSSKKGKLFGSWEGWAHGI